MKFPAALLLAVAAASAPPAPPAAPEPAQAPTAAPAPEPAAEPKEDRGSDYTSQMLDPPLVPEYDPTTEVQPIYAEPSDEDGIRECVGADGVPVFTDRRCSAVNAMPLPPPGAVFGGNVARPFKMHSCARNQDALLAGVRAALENHDANRLADYYHWSGMGSKEGYALMDRLDAFSARPVVDVQLVRGAAADPYDADLWFDTPPPLPPSPLEADPAAATDPGAAEGPAPPPHRRPHASMLRVDQMRGEKDAAATVTYFHLLTNAGCWWMRF